MKADTKVLTTVRLEVPDQVSANLAAHFFRSVGGKHIKIKWELRWPMDVPATTRVYIVSAVFEGLTCGC